ncbi:MAG: hypothetical protein H0X26_09630 [Alphaproteobacteria bacterium]|nr:hypothetical protein [Alphaproteobacteria bacterium]
MSKKFIQTLALVGAVSISFADEGIANECKTPLGPWQDTWEGIKSCYKLRIERNGPNCVLVAQCHQNVPGRSYQQTTYSWPAGSPPPPLNNCAGVLSADACPYGEK